MSSRCSSALPLSAASMDSTLSPAAGPNPFAAGPNPFAAGPNPFAAVSCFLHRHLSRLTAELSARVDEGRRLLRLPVRPASSSFPTLPFAVASQAALPPVDLSASPPPSKGGRHAFDLAMSPEYVAKMLAGTPVYTVSNSNNEFVLISDPNNSLRSLGILCFRQEDAQSLLAQVQLRQPVLGKGARVVPITLDQVYMLKVEGIAFRFLPDPLQIKNAFSLRSADASKGFDGVPVFQSDLLVVKKKNRRYCPIYFQKEDIERELFKVSRPSRGAGYSQNIMVGSLEDVLKKMEMNDKNSGWDDLIFIPPGKTYAEHIAEVAA